MGHNIRRQQTLAVSPKKIPLKSPTRFTSNFRLILLLAWFNCKHFALYFDVISAHSLTDFRCSHVPPAPDQVTHVWLNDDHTNFSASIESFELDDEIKSKIDDRTSFFNGSLNNSTTTTKSRRHINHLREFALPDSTGQRSIWSVLKGMTSSNERSSDRNDLVPIKIQVYYDSSVYLLSQQKLELIMDLVMPSVVKFFESVLSIRRDFTIDKFKISRRCPNNTIYYARDAIGLLRPYCMDRCEDYAVCGEMVVPEAHLSACSYYNSTSKRRLTNYASEGKGVGNTQLLLYVSAKQTARCKKDQTIAYAAHCAQDAKTDRPVAGHANLCPTSISTDPKDLKALIATVKHELTHVLGFSVSLFAYYRDQSGQPLTRRDSAPGPIPVDPLTGYAKWSDKIIKRFVRSGWATGEGMVDKEVHLVVTPTVTREVRNHFNCSTLEGAELEDQGSDGTSMTHWEKRLFENEAMTGTHTQNSVYSRLTLAVLQDTGWYVANFSRAEKLNWGKDLGCDFAMKSCKSWIDERRASGLSVKPFCDRVKGELLQIACTDDKTSKAVCNMKQYKEPLPATYQNFNHLDGVSKENLAHYGGSVDLADYCPFIQEFTWQAQNVTVRGSRCDIGNSNIETLERNAALEHYGPQTKCFEHGRRWEQRSCSYKRHWHHFGAGCYRYSCSNGHFNVIVGNHSYPCYYPDQTIHIEQIVDQWLYNGTLICPPCEKVCSARKCKSYDKRLIDRILIMKQELTLTSEKIDSNEKIRAIVDDALNSIDTSKHDLSNNNIYRKSSVKMIQADPNSNNTIEGTNTHKERLEYKEYLFQVIAQHKKPPRHSLVCSSANAMYTHRVDSKIEVLVLMVAYIISTFSAKFVIIDGSSTVQRVG